MAYVCDIFDMRDFEPMTGLQPSAQQIGHEERRIIPDVRTAVDRRAAGVHRHLPRLAGGKVFLLFCERIVEAKSHRQHHSSTGSSPLPAGEGVGGRGIKKNAKPSAWRCAGGGKNPGGNLLPPTPTSYQKNPCRREWLVSCRGC